MMTLKSSSKLISLTDRRLSPITTGEVWEFPSESCQDDTMTNSIIQIDKSFPRLNVKTRNFTRHGDKERLQEVSMGALVFDTILVSSTSSSSIVLLFFLFSKWSSLLSSSSLEVLVLMGRGRLRGRAVEWRPSLPQSTTWWWRWCCICWRTLWW